MFAFIASGLITESNGDYEVSILTHRSKMKKSGLESPLQVQQTRSAFHPLAQRNTFRHRDVRQQRRSFGQGQITADTSSQLYQALLRFLAGLRIEGHSLEKIHGSNASLRFPAFLTVENDLRSKDKQPYLGVTGLVILSLLCVAEVLPSPARAQSAVSAAIPEMARLAKVLAGDWNTVEIVQHGQPVAEGAGRRGTTQVRLTGGGTALVSEGHSVGTVGGDLRWFITIWWDSNAKTYRFLTCFKTSADAGCELRGTAHWEGETFVNDYEEVIDGKRTRIQDLWTDITPNSHKLTEAHDTGNGVMKPYVVSRSTRQ
ncbi:MAG TPA: hypothetical protein VKH14_03950 [Candidatus Udaeobacter sp.]|nr:MAG: hypothetical protein DME78_01970 [Verrucomicrobiota bacterium]HMC24607.1 hypothetical protein [Candidatus Udaeobacter sp.]